MMQEIHGEFKFPPKGCIDDNQCYPTSKSVNNEALIIDAKPLTSVHPSDFVEDVANSNDASAGDNENPLFGISLPPLPEAGKKLRSLGKRKLPYGVGDSFLKSFLWPKRQVKVSNQRLKRLLERTIDENRASWSKKLEDALWAFRTIYKKPIGCTPYKLVYGKSCHLPIELEHKVYWALKHANFDLKTANDH
nr:reverse transcriptase domain-containing protein [Tanacetum cinerariifolium]